jgi:hypothetical protein
MDKQAAHSFVHSFNRFQDNAVRNLGIVIIKSIGHQPASGFTPWLIEHHRRIRSVQGGRGKVQDCMLRVVLSMSSSSLLNILLHLHSDSSNPGTSDEEQLEYQNSQDP